MKNSYNSSNTEVYIRKGHLERSKAFWSMLDRLTTTKGSKSNKRT